MMDIVRLVAFRVAHCLSLAAAPIFALMAVLAGIDGGAQQMGCSATMHMSPLTGMAPMYALMSAFHLTSWVRLISRWSKKGRGFSRGGVMA